MAGSKSQRPTPRSVPQVTPRQMPPVPPRGTPRVPIPREEPEEGVDVDIEIEVEPLLPGDTMEVQAVSYDTLLDGCRNDAAIDDELAIQAEVARVAIDRSNVKPKKK
jgi:hypothetical protein